MALNVTLPAGFYWLIPPTPTRGGLAGMARPTSQAVETLPALGIGLLISLLSYTVLDGDTPLTLRAIHLPVKNDDVPSSADYPRIAAACAVMHQWRLQLPPLNGVGVHCLQGQGRTGMMLACYRGYLLACYPDDPDALAPEDTAMEVGRRLRDMYDERGLGPSGGQTRFAAWFTLWLKTGSHTDFNAEAVRELAWQRESNLSASAAADQMLWQCSNPDCGSRASHLGNLNAPLWCLSCGQASERGVSENIG